jgi:hypothetical protein
VKTDNSSFERVEEFKYFGTVLTNENSVDEEIKSRLKSGNACCHSVQNLLSSSFLSKNLNIKICRTIILPVVSTHTHKIKPACPVVYYKWFTESKRKDTSWVQ